jgi:hypothetical protein
MVLENGENWKPSEPQLRGRHATFDSALDAAVADMLAEKSPFFDSLPDMWPKLFPGLAAMPGRYEDGRIVLYVKNSAALYIVRMKLAQIRSKLAALPGAPKTIELRLEVHS